MFCAAPIEPCEFRAFGDTPVLRAGSVSPLMLTFLYGSYVELGTISDSSVSDGGTSSRPPNGTRLQSELRNGTTLCSRCGSAWRRMLISRLEQLRGEAGTLTAQLIEEAETMGTELGDVVVLRKSRRKRDAQFSEDFSKCRSYSVSLRSESNSGGNRLSGPCEDV
ncbi:hypothetical protein AOLI_G00252720 [Acnodon oligacanthus]